MSSEELRRVEVMARVKSGGLKVGDAGEMLGVSYRQAKRLWKRYRKCGAEGLRHGNAGKPSNRAKPKKFRRQVLQLVKRKYSGDEGSRFGPTLAAEHLAAEDGLELAAVTLRRWMLAEGLWSRVRKGREHRRRRTRREHFGELVQMDGSFHAWLEGRGPAGCMMNMVDDATSTTMLRLGQEETTWAAAHTLRRWIEEYGVPLALYTDWKNVYQRAPTEKEALRGEVPVTQFGRMCEKLGIRLIGANSPQAKGRVERSNGTHQDRLIKKMRRKKIATYAQANAYLAEEYLAEHNQRFACAAGQPEDYHRRAPSRRELDRIFRLETERTVSQDWVVRYDNRYFQLERQSRYAPTRGKVLVCEWEDGRLAIEYRGKEVAWKQLPGAPGQGAVRRPRPAKRSAPTPAVDHPWRRRYQDMRVAVVAPPEAPTLVRVATSATP